MEINPIVSDNQMEEDMCLNHEKAIFGIVYHAVREITGKDPDENEMSKHLGIMFYDHKRFFEWMWKGEAIVRVHRVSVEQRGNDYFVRHRKVEELWKKRWRLLH